MTSVVEAKSLSALTTLASNPPRYPRNPTHEEHEPLVLYIERVPGSRDVFLTPMKPREKVVTAEDVQSSLYYLHFDDPQDEELKAAALDNGAPQNTESDPTPIIRKPVRRPLPDLPSDFSESGSIRRKPVSSTPALSIKIDSESLLNVPTTAPSHPQTPPASLSSLAHRRGRSTELAAAKQENLRPTLENRRWSTQAPVRRQSPSRQRAELPFWMQDQPKRRKSPAKEPQSPYSTIRGFGGLANEPQSPYSTIRSYGGPAKDSQSPYFTIRSFGGPPKEPQSPYSTIRSFGGPAKEPQSPYSTIRTFAGRPENDLFSPGPEESDQGMSLTLIRRDPASGAQWNVGKVKDPPSFEISSDNYGRSVQERVRKPGAPLYIDINNPGYSKFLFNPDMVSPRRSEDSMNSVHSGRAGSRSSFASPTGPAPVDSTFRRRMWYEGARYTPDYFGHKKAPSNENNLSVPGSTPMGVNSPFDEMDNQRRISMGTHDRRSGYRGYVFESPWNGRCEFVTGGSGDSLKCRHILPLTNAAIQTSPEVVTVSELRFNLPSTRGQPSTIDERASKRPSFLNRPAMHRQTSSLSTRPPMQRQTSYISSRPPMHRQISSLSSKPSAQDILGGVASLDLSLGLEYAGGGFGGKQAKLGKLIIRDEGLKMMDLVVAANMSLWCRAYEKVEAAGRSRNDPRNNTDMP